jgi:hypothetical protein
MPDDAICISNKINRATKQSALRNITEPLFSILMFIQCRLLQVEKIIQPLQ